MEELYSRVDGNPRLIVIIVTYNSEYYAERLAKSIASQNYDQKKILVIVIDNTSIDNTISIFHKIFSTTYINYVIVRLKNNLGFSAANNLAILLAKKLYKDLSDKIIILLNPDTYILNKNFFKIVEKIAARLPLVGFATISGNHEDVIDGLGGYIDFLGNPTDILCCVKRTEYIDRFIEKLPGIYPVPAVCFAAVAIRGDALEEIGLLRNDYVMYFEDTEYSLRAWSSGIPVHVCRKFVIWHARGGTQKQHSPRQGRRSPINVKLHFTKNMIMLTYEYLGPLIFVARLVLYSFISIMRRDKETMLAIVTALRLIRGRKIRARKLPRRLLERNPKNSIIFYAIKYKLRFPHSPVEEAMKYGAIRLSIIGLLRFVRLKLGLRN